MHPIQIGANLKSSFACKFQRGPAFASADILFSMVEGFIAIIVSSMPATASFFKAGSGNGTGSHFFGFMRSHFFSTRGGASGASGKKESSNGSRSTKRSYTVSDNLSESNAHLRDNSYLELKDVPSQATLTQPMPTQTSAYSNGPNRDIEEGIIEKSVDIDQAARHYRL